MSVEETFVSLYSRVEGLATEEADARRTLFGANTVREDGGFSRFWLFIGQIKSPLILVLVAAGLITGFFEHWVDTAVIFAAVFVNTALGFWQEYKAETALSHLKTYIRTRSRVRRNGVEREIDAEELVPGDVIRISQGDRIPADIRITYANNFDVDESILTGESLPEAKSADPVETSIPLADRTSMAYGGTLAVQGFADAIVTATGENTEFGKIAAMVREQKSSRTPLQDAIARFVVRAGFVLAFLIFLLFIFGIAVGYSLFDIFLISVAVAVSAVPEGLPIAVTVILAVGVQRLASRKGIVRKLLAAETLGSTSLILTDKTGTLTEAKMSLAGVIPYSSGKEAEEKLILKALGTFDVVLENPDDDTKKWKLVGHPLEISLVVGASKRGILYRDILRSREFLDRLPFTSANKFSASVTRIDGRVALILFGAPDILLPFTGLSGKEKETVMNQINERALKGERILGVASRVVSKEYHISREARFEGLFFDGLITFRDPLRPTAHAAIKRIGDAGVKTIIVTGDHTGTAEAVGRELGMIDGGGAVLSGEDLRFLSHDELFERADKTSIYARVSPEDKLMLAKLYKEKGEIVAVTGDGVNDAPALKEAHIGVAVGSGTDVAKGASDLVLLDDNFETLVAAIEEGRRAADNVRKVIVYLLSDALDELLLIGGSILAGLPLPITALQILFVNFFSDSFPAIALAFKDGIDGLGKRPRKLARNLFDPEMRFLILVIGFFSSAFLFFLYYWMIAAGFAPELVRTFIFASFSTHTLFVVFSVRSLEKSILSYNPFSNRYLLVGSGIGVGLTACAIYVPWFQNILGTSALPFLWIMGALAVSAINITAIEMGKSLFRRKNINS